VSVGAGASGGQSLKVQSGRYNKPAGCSTSVACRGRPGKQTNKQANRMVVRLSALRTSRLYPQEILLVLISVKRLSRPQGHGAFRRIMSVEKSDDTIWNRISNLPICSTVPQPLCHRGPPLYQCSELLSQPTQRQAYWQNLLNNLGVSPFFK
jgi:hypothetical protein